MTIATPPLPPVLTIDDLPAGGGTGLEQIIQNAVDASLETSLNTALAGVQTQIGTLGSLTTTDKTNLVVALNEAITKIGTLSSLTTTTKTSLVAALNELKSTVASINDTSASSSSVYSSQKTDTLLAAKANDNAVVKTTGAQSVAGDKTTSGIWTFGIAPSVPDDSFAITKVTGLNDALAGKQPAGSYATTSQLGNVSADLGTKSSLTTTDKSSLVAAVNELVSLLSTANTNIATKADDSAVVKLTGAQTVAGTKTFSSAPAVPDGSFAIAKTTGLQTALDGKSDKTNAPVNVMDATYGVSGTTDNTSAIQAALDAASAAGRNVHFPQRPLGQPYMLGGTGFLLKVAAGVRVTADPGVVWKVKNSNGNYKAMLGGTLSSTDLSGLSIQGVTFDQNSSGNAVSDVATLLVEGTQRFCVFVGVGSVIRIKDCLFQNIDGLNTLYLGGSAMKDVRVQDCEFDLVGTSPAWHDHSTIYTSCDGSTITGNKFRGILGSNGATTAIETHGPNQTISANRIDGYKIGMNVTGITNLGNDGIAVTENVIRNAMIGIQLWSWSGTNGGLVDVDVSHNRIHLNRDPWTLASTDHPRGICMNQSASGGNSVTNIEGLRIKSNTIRFGTFASSQTNDYLNASGIELVSQDSSVEIRDFDISSNLVVAAIGPAMRIGCKMRRGVIHDNEWRDPSSTSQALGTPAGFTTFWRTGMSATGNADFYDTKMWGNRTFDTRGTHVLAYAFATSLSSGNVARCEEWDNTVACSDGTVLPLSSQTTGKKFTKRSTVVQFAGYSTGQYLFTEGSRGNITATIGNEMATPLWIYEPVPVVEISCNVATAGSGSTVRLGIRVDNGSGSVSSTAPLLDAGTVDSSTTGNKQITFTAITLQPGLYWLTATAQGTTAPQLTGVISATIGGAPSTSAGSALQAQARCGQYQTGVSGALPSTWTLAGQISPALVALKLGTV